EVSLLSAASVLNAIDTDKYEVVPIGITKDGRWLTAEHAENLLTGKLKIEGRHLRAGDPETTPSAAVLTRGEAVVVPPEPVHRQTRYSSAQRLAEISETHRETSHQQAEISRICETREFRLLGRHQQSAQSQGTRSRH